MDLNLQGKVAIVTGGARGIGEGIAKMLADEGARVIIADRDTGLAERTVASMGGSVHFEYMDVTDKNSVQNAVSHLFKQFGTIDILVNNAGIGNKVPFTALSSENLESVFKVNVFGTIWVTQSVIEHMASNKYGKIINISALAGVDPKPFYVHYSASKAAIIALTKAVALEYAEHNLNINCICPGAVDTKLWTQVFPESFGELCVGGGCGDRSFALGRSQKIEDIAHMVCYLASDVMKNVTGQNFFITS